MTSNAPVRERESAKQRAGRIPLDYYRQCTRLDAVKWWLTGVLGATALAYAGWLVYGVTRGWPAALRHISPGEVATSHHAWNDRCDACHAMGLPLRDDATGIRLLDAVLNRQSEATGEPRASGASSADQRCQACHPVVVHHPQQVDREIDACASCHRDHQGRDADLRRVADRRCTTCHRDIQAHRHSEISASSAAANVVSWAEHPPSRSLQRGDPGTLRFNHRLHLLPGQYPRNARESGPTRLKSIDRSAWSRYGYSSDAALETVVELDCAACHQTDELDPNAVDQNRYAPTRGASMLPIRFAQHCAPCHSDDLAVSIPTDEGVARGQIPHGLRAQEVRRYVWGLVGEPQEAAGDLVPPRPIPGRSGTSGAHRRGSLEQGPRINHALGELRGGHRCGKCHLYDDDRAVDSRTSGPASRNESDSRIALEPSLGMHDEILPTAIPAVWMPRARFDHAAHRAVKCQECHSPTALTWSEDGKPPLDDRVPIIPDLDACRRCHVAAPGVGARADCVECHDYHGADLAPDVRARARHTLPPENRRGATEWMAPDRTSSEQRDSANSLRRP